jgi:glycosyltransferase involved in cell wall biosynthesis
MTTPLVSVVLPTRNRAHVLGLAIRSVLDQTERNIELIVVDDASTDGTLAILNQFAKIDSRIKILQNREACGGGGARNVGIAASSGEWVAFLDDDDAWMGNKLRTQLEELAVHSSPVACSCSYERYTATGRKSVVRIRDDITLQQLFRLNYLGGASMCLASRSVLLSIGGFDTKLRSGQDWDLWVRLRYKGYIAVCAEPLIKYQDHNGARISNNMDAQYLGARRFYFKHRQAMNYSLRRYRISYNCFIMSRQPKRCLTMRLRYLMLSLRHSGLGSGWSYIRSSLPRLIHDWFRKFILRTFKSNAPG